MLVMLLLKLRLYRGGKKGGCTYYYVGAQRFNRNIAARLARGNASELPTLETAPEASCETLTTSPPNDSTTLTALSTA